MFKKLGWVFGVLFVAIGIFGLVPFSAGGFLFGVFSISSTLAVVYLASGIVALLAVWRSETGARLYFKVFGIVYAVMTIAGFLEGDSVFGLLAVNGADNALHLVAAAVALWAGFGAKADPAQGE